MSNASTNPHPIEENSEKPKPAGLQSITDAQFEAEVLKSEEAVLVDFWAPWCRPCTNLMPVLESLATEDYQNHPIRFVKINIDENPETPTAYNVRGIPYLMLFKKGEVVGQKMGVSQRGELKELIDSQLGIDSD